VSQKVQGRTLAIRTSMQGRRHKIQSMFALEMDCCEMWLCISTRFLAYLTAPVSQKVQGRTLAIRTSMQGRRHKIQSMFALEMDCCEMWLCISTRFLAYLTAPVSRNVQGRTLAIRTSMQGRRREKQSMFALEMDCCEMWLCISTCFIAHLAAPVSPKVQGRILGVRTSMQGRRQTIKSMFA